MLGTSTIIFALLFPATVLSQAEVWIKLDRGAALYLSPASSEWIPVSAKQKIPAKTYVLTKPETAAVLFRETTSYELPPSSYFFVEDVFQKSRVELVAALTRIEAEQLPVNTYEPGEENRRPLGLIYGESREASPAEGTIVFEREREQTVTWFIAQGRHAAALLCMKRAMTKFPALYLRQAYAEQLLWLYNRLELYGFLLEESSRLLALQSSEAFQQTVKAWNETAKRKLVRLEN